MLTVIIISQQQDKTFDFINNICLYKKKFEHSDI